MKYKDIDIDVNQETKEKLVQKRKEKTSFILSDERGGTFTMAFFVNFVALFGGIILLISIANWQSKRRIKYLPLKKETMKELNINTIEDYCKFLNEFLLVTPTGKEAKEGSSFFGIAEIPKEILEEINSNFPVEDGRIAWDDFYSAYYVLERN